MTETPVTVIGQVSNAPGQEQMNMGDGMMVFQETSQCCRCCCLQPNIHWVLHNYDDNWNPGDTPEVIGNITEKAPYIGRCCSYCYPGFRNTVYEVREGQRKEGNPLFTHEKGWTLPSCCLIVVSDNGPVRVPCCCCLPYLETKDSHGTKIGTSRYVCDAFLCVPKFDMFNKKDQHIYRVRPDTCVGGCCVRCRCCDNNGGGGGKGKCCRVPFIVRKPFPPHEQVDDAAITDLWAGFKAECCTQREMYAVKFPKAGSEGMKDDATTPDNVENVKKTLIGMTLLVDITVNEQDD